MWRAPVLGGLISLCLGMPGQGEPGEASHFAGLYGFQPAPLVQGGDDYADAPGDLNAGLAADAPCIAAIKAAEQRYALPENLLLAVGLQEAGTKRNGQTTIWPWAVNSEGAGYMFGSKQAAVDFVKAERALGKTSIDLGCLQVNMRWHPEAFASVEAGFDPKRNADYAARFLRALYAQTGDWRAAVGNYHSRTPSHHARYLAGVDANLAYLGTGGALASPKAQVQIASASSETLDDVLSAFAAQGRAALAPEAPPAPAGWGNQGAESLSIYSHQPLRPVLSGFMVVPDA